MFPACIIIYSLDRFEFLLSIDAGDDSEAGFTR